MPNLKTCCGYGASAAIQGFMAYSNCSQVVYIHLNLDVNIPQPDVPGSLTTEGVKNIEKSKPLSLQ